MTERRRIFILNNPTAPRLCPELALEIGLNESILLLQIEFWISISNHYIDGKWWTYQSVRDIKKTFVFWGLATINRTIKSLEQKGLIEVANYNQRSYDRTRWLAISEQAIHELEAIKVFQVDTPLSQNGTPSSQNGTGSDQNGTTIPETTTETTSKNTTKDKRAKPSPSSNGTEVTEVFDGMRAFYRYPDETEVDPIPNYGKEGKAIKRMLDRGFTIVEILETWIKKCQKAGVFKSMVYVNEDIGEVPKGRRQDDPDRFIKGKYGDRVQR